MDSKLKPGIYLEIKGVNASDFPGFRNGVFGKKHAYLIYRKANGSTEIIRGGPGTSFRRIIVETGKALEGSDDKYEAFEEPNSRPSRRLPIKAEKLNETWARMRKHTEQIGKASLLYSADLDPEDIDQTSNSVIRSVLESENIPLDQALPEGADMDDMPGIRDTLEDELKEAEERQKNPGKLQPIKEDSVYDKIMGSQGDDDLSEDRKTLAADLAKDDGPEAELMVKDGADLTKGELRQIMAKRNRLPEGPEKDQLNALEKEHFSAVYGNAPVEQDAIGRTIEPKAKRTVAEQPVPAKTSSGDNLNDALKELGERIVADKSGDNKTRIAQALQVGLNLALRNAQEKQQPQNQPKRPSLFNALKVDGIVGPKTRQATRAILAKTQPGTVEEGLALGQFKKIVDEGRRRPVEPEALRQSISKIFGPLFRGPEKAAPKVSHEGVGLQLALNKFGENDNGEDRFTPLKEDGFIGPKTADAFGKVMKVSNPDDFLSRLGERLGFFG